jgi:hypothetical protein
LVVVTVVGALVLTTDDDKAASGSVGWARWDAEVGVVLADEDAVTDESELGQRGEIDGEEFSV